MADAKISSFASGTPASADLLTFVSDPSGTPANEVITYSAFVSGLTITESQISDLGTYATQAYVDSAVAGLYDHKGAYNASTNSPDLDTSPSGVLKGDAYTVSVAGTFFSASVDAGDVLIADQDSPTLESHWTIVNRNIDESAFASASHASNHTDGTDDIQDATAAQKGLATAAQITKLDGIETSATADQSDAEIETAYNAQVGVVSQAEAEAGTSTTVRRWTAERVKQAIAALETGGGGGGGGLTITSKTTGYTAADGDLVSCDASGGAFTITMPASPSTDDRIGIYLENGSFTLAVTIQGNGNNLAEYGTSVALKTPGDLLMFQYDGSKWIIESNGLQTESLDSLAAASIDEDDDGVRLYDGDAAEDYEKRASVKSMGAPYVQDTALGTAAGDLYFRPSANTHWSNLPKGSDGEVLTMTSGLPAWGSGSDVYRNLQTAQTAGGNVWRVSPTLVELTASTAGVTADTLYAVPFVVGNSDTADRIGIDVQSSAAGSVRLGIYNSSGGAPSSLLLDAGTVSVSTTGQKNITISQALSPGMYFLALVSDVAPTIAGIDETEMLWSYGLQSQVGSTQLNRISASHTYAALPDPFPSITLDTGNNARISLRF